MSGVVRLGRKTAGFPKLTGKESCRKWQRSFFYVRSLGKNGDYVNLPPFESGGPAEQTTRALLFQAPARTWSKFFSGSSLSEGRGLKVPALLLAFISAHVSPL
jgi:hypothetical protein